MNRARGVTREISRPGSSGARSLVMMRSHIRATQTPRLSTSLKDDTRFGTAFPDAR